MLADITLHDKTFEDFISDEQIQQRVSEITADLEASFGNKRPLFLAVLNGSFMFFSDLMKSYQGECEMSFVKLASYRGMSSTGKVDQLIGLTESLNDRDVVVVEDIVDTGNTLDSLLSAVSQYNPKSVTVCTLLLKPEVYNKNYEISSVGFEIPNEFVVGYGMDYDGLGRNLADIYKVCN